MIQHVSVVIHALAHFLQIQALHSNSLTVSELKMYCGVRSYHMLNILKIGRFFKLRYMDSITSAYILDVCSTINVMFNDVAVHVKKKPRALFYFYMVTIECDHLPLDQMSTHNFMRHTVLLNVNMYI